MKIIVGLGNPGTKYEKTRHNAGFLAIDSYIENCKLKIENLQNNFKSQVVDTIAEDKKIILVKPQTFMNNSGEAVREICDFYKVDVTKDLIVIHDEIDLPLGTIRTSNGSSSAGHNGVKSIIEHLGTKDFRRIRIGVEAREANSPIETADFVLQNFSADELSKLQTEVLPKVNEEIESFLKIEK